MQNDDVLIKALLADRSREMERHDLIRKAERAQQEAPAARPEPRGVLLWLRRRRGPAPRAPSGRRAA